MREPFMPPFLMLVGLAFGYWGWRRAARAMRKPAVDISASPYDTPKFDLEATFWRVRRLLNSISIFAVGVAVFILGTLELMGLY